MAILWDSTRNGHYDCNWQGMQQFPGRKIQAEEEMYSKENAYCELVLRSFQVFPEKKNEEHLKSKTGHIPENMYVKANPDEKKIFPPPPFYHAQCLLNDPCCRTVELCAPQPSCDVPSPLIWSGLIYHLYSVRLIDSLADAIGINFSLEWNGRWS